MSDAADTDGEDKPRSRTRSSSRKKTPKYYCCESWNHDGQLPNG